MFIKRFIAKDMQDAIKKIRKEFGPDAVIIDSKAIRNKGIKGIFQKKVVEVVAAYEPDKSKPLARRFDTDPPKKEEKTAVDNVVREDKMKQLGDQILTLQNAVKDFSNKIRLVNKETTLTFTPEILELYNTLIEQDVNEELAKEIAQQTQRVCGEKAVDIDFVAQNLVLDKLGEQRQLKLRKFEKNVWMFAGPTGVGKTTTLAKLAGMFALNQKLDVGLINMDTYRIGAMEHIKIYADIIGVPLLTAYSAQELKDAKKQFEDKDLILIDTAGRTPEDEIQKKDMLEIIKAADVDELFLVISVVTGIKACKNIINNFSFYDEYKLILTKLDEASAWGNVLNITSHAKKSPSYISNGQNVPDDICEPDLKKLADSICGGERFI